MCSVCTAEQQVTVVNTKIMSVSQKRYYGEFIQQATVKRIHVFM